MLAMSTLLLPISKLGVCTETMPLLRSVEMGLEVLEAMDESITARRSAEIIRQYLRYFQSAQAAQQPTDELPQFGVGKTFEVPVCILILFSYDLLTK